MMLNDSHSSYSDTDLAALTGFALETDSSTSTCTVPDATAFDDVLEIEPTQTWSSNPLIQLGVAAGIVGAIALALFTLTNNVSLPQASVSDAPTNPTPPSPSSPTTERGDIKASLAFGSEGEQLAALADTQEPAPETVQNNGTQNTASPVEATKPSKTITGKRPTPAVKPLPVLPPTPVAAQPVRPAPQASFQPSLQTVRYTPPAPVVTPAVTPVLQAATPSAPPKPGAIPAVAAQNTGAEKTEAQSLRQPENAALPSATDKAVALKDKSTASTGVTIPVATRVSAVVETPVLVGQVPALKSQVRLSETITSLQGETLLPAGSLLIAEPVTSSGRGIVTSTYLRISGAFIEDDGQQRLIPFPGDAVIGLARCGDAADNPGGGGEVGLFQSPHQPASAPQTNQRRGGIASGIANGIDWQKTLITGAIATMDLDRDDFLGGVALDVLGQLGNQQPARMPQPVPTVNAQPWSIAAGTELVVYINQPVTVPAPATGTKSLEPAPTAADPNPVLIESVPTDSESLIAVAADVSPPATAEEATHPLQSLVGFGSVPYATVPVALRPGVSQTLSFLTRHETILNAWVNTPNTVTFSYDQPVSSGKAAVIQVQLKDPLKMPSDADAEAQVAEPTATGSTTNPGAITLDVITKTSANKRRWHRFLLQPVEG